MECRICLPLIPTPKKATGVKEDGTFSFRTYPARIACSEKQWKNYADAFSEDAKRVHGVSFAEGEGGLLLLCDRSVAAGHYRLIAAENALELRAFSADGVTAGLASVLQLMRCDKAGFRIQEVVIDDYPETDYRCFMIDLARQWHPFEQVLRYVDICHLYKINKLQLHFIDDQSYTLPSDILPGLPTKDRHYTKEQIAYLNKYAADRGVTLIPEFEVPGHSRALVSAYPEKFSNIYDPEGIVGEDNIFCTGREGVFELIDSLIGEVCELFPDSPYIHLGGDEANRHIWDRCELCREYMKKNGLAGSAQLYSHFMERVTNMVINRGRKPVVWEGFPKEGDGQISRDVIVIAWESMYRYAPELLESGFTLVNCSWQPNYIVPYRPAWSYSDILAWNIYNWQNWNPGSPAHLNPFNVPPTDRVLGGMMCCWEWNYESEIGYVRSNLSALAERTWTIRRLCETEEFGAKLEEVLPVAERLTGLK